MKSMANSDADSSQRTRTRCLRCARIIICVGIAEALVFMVLKVSLGLAWGSRALVAASLYSIQDLIASLVAATGMRISAKPADRDHPYGHGKFEYMVAVTMSLMILLGIIALAITSLAGFWGSVTDAEPPALPALWIALVCGIACWLLSKRQECAGQRLNSPALMSCAAHMHSDYIASVAVVVSVIGAKLGYPALDHIVAVVEAVHVVFVSGRMLGSAVSGLMDTAADPDIVERLKRVVGELEAVARVRRAVARWAGQTLLAQIDVEVPGSMAVRRADKVRKSIQQAVRREVCDHSETFVRISPARAT
ncbi:MAG: cation diffusion facilitator family transporter [Planctomycetota bacterium]|jgi:cation diffusion facilitator family transporter